MRYSYVLDTYAWAEFFDGTAKGRRVRELIETEHGRIGTSIMALAEFSDKCAREGRDVERLVSFIEGKSAILQLTRDIALKSGELKAALRKVSKNISLADSIHFQTAKEFDAVFITGDPDFQPLKQNKDVMLL